jgi:hypothetical protein
MISSDTVLLINYLNNFEIIRNTNSKPNITNILVKGFVTEIFFDRNEKIVLLPLQEKPQG